MSIFEYGPKIAYNMYLENAINRKEKSCNNRFFNVPFSDYFLYYALVRKFAGECEYEFKPTPPRNTANEVFPFWNRGYTLYLTTAMDRTGNWNAEKAYDRYKAMAEMRAPSKRD